MNLNLTLGNSFAAKKRNIQRFFLIAGIGYLLFLFIFAFYKSSARKSLLSNKLFADYAASDLSQSGDNSTFSKLQLQDFHRQEVHDGKTVWEISARDAKYYPFEAVTHVNDLKLQIFSFKKDQKDVKVFAKSARLYLEGSNLLRASLDGSIVIQVGDNFELKTEGAEFDAKKKLFTAKAEVAIVGNGFSVKGADLSYPVDGEILTLNKNVNCEFQPGAELPKGLEVK